MQDSDAHEWLTSSLIIRIIDSTTRNDFQPVYHEKRLKVTCKPKLATQKCVRTSNRISLIRGSFENMDYDQTNRIKL